MFRLKRPFKALIYDDTNYAYSRNRAAGMSYLNRFIIEEDTQFECAGVVEYKFGSSWEDIMQYLEKNFNRLSNKSNSDFISHVVLSDVYFSIKFLSDSIRETFLEILNVITRIESQRIECVQKEYCEKIYTEGGQIQLQSYTISPVEVHGSIGNEIDDFYDRIKMNKINFNHRKLHTISELFWRSPYTVKTFHLSMLTNEEEIKMHSENADNRKFDNFQNKTTLSKREPNYALSLCTRKTILMRSLENGEMDIMHMIEPDPWQERIKDNFEELTRLNEKRKAEQEALRETKEALEYCQTHWELNSSDYSDSN